MPFFKPIERIKSLPQRTALTYTIVAGLYIVFSDRALEILVPDPQVYVHVQTYKGWAFVLITGLLLYLNLNRQIQRLEQETARREQTERQNRRAVEETRTVRSYTEHLLRTVNVLFIQLDRSGRVVRLNEAAEEISGYSRAELEGQNWFDLLVPRQRYPAVWEEFERDLDMVGPLRVFENPILTRSGAERHILWKNSVLRENGQVSGTISFGIDITEHKRAEALLRQRLVELEALHIIAAELRKAETRSEAMPILLKETLSALGSDSGIIWLYQPRLEQLQVAAALGRYALLENAQMDEDEGIPGSVFSTGQSMVYSNLSQDPILPSDQPVFTPAGCAGAFFPIKSEEGSVGVLFVSMPGGYEFPSEQVRLLESLVEMTGSALHRMRLHEETTHRLEQLQALHNIDLSITAGMDLHKTLDTLLEHLTGLLKMDAAAVLLLNSDEKSLDYAAGRGFLSAEVENIRIPLGHGFAGAAAQNRAPVQVDDPVLLHQTLLDLASRESFSSYLGVPLITKDSVKGVLEVFHRTPFRPEPEWMAFLETLSSQAAIAIDNAQLFEGLQRANLELTQAYDATIEGWSHALDLRDRETEGHSQRVSEVTTRLAQWFGLPESEIIHVRRGAFLHDIGKMGIPDTILLKKSSLDAAEWEIMRRHPQYAYDLLSPIAYLRPALEIPLYHHEKWDGSGYPFGRKGEDIPFVARIFAVVDVWDALRSDRPYRPAWPVDQVLAHIRALSGSHFDPQVVEAFLQIVSES